MSLQRIKEVECFAPVKTVSEMNRRDHWAVRLERKKNQQQEVLVAMQNALRGRSIQLPCTVKLTRVGPRTLDDDNLRSSLKFCRDQVAAKLGVDDGDVENVKWEYAQKPVRQFVYGVKIQIVSA